MKMTYKIPEGVECMLLPGDPDYIAVCAKPDRAPWFVTHDGVEVDVLNRYPLDKYPPGQPL
jgi:hypothetical protein